MSFDWNVEEYPGMGLKDGRQIGLVAQDVEKALPELVSKDKDGYKAISYTKLTAVLVEAVKELKTENESLKTENAMLKKDIENIKTILGI